jgi:S1-C subfamily serine protease
MVPSRALSFILFVGFFALPDRAVFAAEQSNSPVSSGQQWVDVVDKVRGAIVTIETQNQLGTGFLIAKNGTLVTNFHVIKDAQELSVTLQSGEVYKAAYLIRTDEEKDIAILRIEAADLPFVDLGNSDGSRVGEEVMTIGSPEGLEQTVSTGIVSGRRLMPAGYALLQTTAPISHGSSGGPLLNRDGKTIGIITAFFAEGQNLNFAVPINYVRGIVDTLVLSSTPPRLISARTGTVASTRDAAQTIKPKPATTEPVPPTDRHLLKPPVSAPTSVPSAPTKRDDTPICRPPL